jgi:hypothetical protein
MLFAIVCAACSGASDKGAASPAATEEPAAVEPEGGATAEPAAETPEDEEGLPCPDDPACGGD